jgi:microcystin-dependent protein
MDPFLGQIMLVPYNFVPVNWLPCDGRLLSIPQFSALFSLLGTTYGGNGQTTFALPDLRSRIPIGAGQQAGDGLTPVPLGEQSGAEVVTLVQNQMPAHIHSATVSIGATSQPGTSQSPDGLVPAMTTDSLGANVLAYGPPDHSTRMAGNNTVTTGTAGGSQPVSIRNPYLGLQYIISTVGVFPSRQ